MYIYMYIFAYIHIFAIMKTICPLGYLHKGSLETYALRLMTYSYY